MFIYLVFPFLDGSLCSFLVDSFLDVFVFFLGGYIAFNCRLDNIYTGEKELGRAKTETRKQGEKEWTRWTRKLVNNEHG